MKTQSLLLRMFVALFIAIFINGCAKKASLKTTFSQSTEKMDHILVLALEKNDRKSNGLFENKVVNAIKEQDVNATSFFNVSKGISKINEESVKSVVKSIDASGVLVTQLKSIDYDTDVKSGRIETIRSPNKFDSFGDLFNMYDFKKIQSQNTITLSVSVKITADLYSTSTGKIIWSAESKTIQREYATEVLDDLSKSISQGLKNSKLL